MPSKRRFPLYRPDLTSLFKSETLCDDPINKTLGQERHNKTLEEIPSHNSIPDARVASSQRMPDYLTNFFRWKTASPVSDHIFLGAPGGFNIIGICIQG